MKRLLKAFLKVQQRRILKKHTGEGTHQYVMLTVTAFTLLTFVRDSRKTHGHILFKIGEI